MKISRKTIKHIGKLITGDGGYSPYRSGPKLVDYFVEFGADDYYGDGFPSRWQYVEDKLAQFNDTPVLRKIIEAAVDPRDYMESDFFVHEAVGLTNEYLAYDGYELVQDGKVYRIRDANGVLVAAEAIDETEHERVHHQIEKCLAKIEGGDYDGAITNARTMLETIMISVIEDHEGKEIKNSGDLLKLYKQVKSILNLHPTDKLPATVQQILTGLHSITSGIAGLSNEFGDRHAHKNVAAKHHAKLAVNAAMTLADFLVDSREYQARKKARASK
jgi:hypothetical protein